MEKTFLIIDGNSLACRSAFAYNPRMFCNKIQKFRGEYDESKKYNINDVVTINGDRTFVCENENSNINDWKFLGEDLKNIDGKLTGCTFRFINILDKLLTTLKPTHVIVGWDIGRKTFRKELYDDYKGTRENKNNEFYSQFDDIKQFLKLIGIKNESLAGFEGDDIIGTFAELSKADKNYIVSGDKDSYQLVNDNTFIIKEFKGKNINDWIIVDKKHIYDEFNVEPEKIIDLKMIMGDDGDNIKGIDGCGTKTAIKLLNHYGTVEKLVENYNKIEVKGVSKKVKENIIEWKDRYSLLKQLVTIRKDVDVKNTFEDCEIHLNWENSIEFCKKLNLNSVLKKISGGKVYGEK